MSKYTFTCHFTPDQLDRCNIANKITFEFESDSLDQILGQFTDFLKGAGFHLDGNVEIVNDLPVQEEKDNNKRTDFHTITPLTSGIAPSDEIERFLHKKNYIIKVEKMCSAHIMVEAENEQKAKEMAENLKNHFVLDWK